MVLFRVNREPMKDRWWLMMKVMIVADQVDLGVIRIVHSGIVWRVFDQWGTKHWTMGNPRVKWERLWCDGLTEDDQRDENWTDSDERLMAATVGQWGWWWCERWCGRLTGQLGGSWGVQVSVLWPGLFIQEKVFGPCFFQCFGMKREVGDGMEFVEVFGGFRCKCLRIVSLNRPICQCSTYFGR